ncbi:MAG: DUF1080 domain-containing protein [Balneolaceae bacterium]
MNMLLRFPNLTTTGMLLCIFLTAGIYSLEKNEQVASVDLPPDSVSHDDGFKLLFNGYNFDGWYTFIPDYGKNNDPDEVFNTEDEMLYITGQHFGYLATEDTYSNFHLKLEFKWGEKKWPPRLDQKRDSGICYHFDPETDDKVWPQSVECQIQEGDTGDFWLIGNTTIEIDGKRNEPGDFVQVVKKHDTEKPHGAWNTVEVISYNGSATHIVNGVVVNHGDQASVQSGKILLQSEGAEIYYRNIQLKEL